MKRFTFAAIAALAALTGFAGAQNDKRLFFETQGTDTYKDGKAVLDGEFYALVWTPSGSAFGGFAADGSLVSAADELVAMVPFAKGGRLPTTKKEIAASLIQHYAEGAFTVVSLDTRKADGTLSTPIMKDGRPYPSAVQGYEAAATASAADAALYAALKVNASIKLESVSAIPDGVGQPKIIGVKKEGGFLVLTVTNTKEFLRYNIAGGATPGTIGTEGKAEAPKDGASSETGEIELRVPVDANATSGFFKVIRN